MKPFVRSFSPGNNPGKAFPLLVTLAIAVLALVPIYVARFLPINDYPFHLARMIILAQLDNPIFARFYEYGSFLLPNVAMDAFVVPLSGIFGAEPATKIFVELTLLVMLLGAMALHWAAHKRLSVWPLLAVAFLHNGIFRFGFFNYLFGLGLALAAAALWLTMNKGMARLVTAFIACVVLIFCHMESFGVFALIVGATEFHHAVLEWRRTRSWNPVAGLALSAVPFVLTLALFFLLSPTAGVAGRFAYAPGWGTKPVGALFSLSSGILWLDALTVAVLLAVCAWLFLTKRLVIFWPLATALLFVVLALFALPATLMDSLYGDTRLGPAIALLGIAALDIRVDAPKFAHWTLVGLALSLALLRSGVLATTWIRYDAEIASVVKAFDNIEPGATLFSATSEPFVRLIADTPERAAAWSPPVKHIASYAVLHAPVFVPMTFTDPTKQPLAVSRAYQAVTDFQHENPALTPDQKSLSMFIDDLQRHLESSNWPEIDPAYVLIMGRDRLEPMRLPPSLSPVAQSDRYVLLKYLPHTRPDEQ